MPTRNQLARVHIAKKELQLTDALYRDFLELWFGKRSAKNLTSDEIEALLIHFKGLGWGQTPKNPQWASPAQLYKMQKLWTTGAGIRIKTLTAFEHFLRRHFHIPGLSAVKANQVGAIIGAIRKIAEGPASGNRSSRPKNDKYLHRKELVSSS
jgi:uncharacterized protein DUF1018